MALPVLVVVLATAIWVLAAVGAQLACVDAARAAARAAARGDAAARVLDVGRRVAPDGAQVLVSPAGGQVEVVVRAQVRPFGPASVLPALQVSARAVAEREPAAPGPAGGRW